MALTKGTSLRRGRYQVQRLLARGGFGFIYLALDTLTGRQVVLKELLPALADDAEVRRRFVREGRTMQRLAHPNIARVEAMFNERGNVYMVVEYLAGGSLGDLLERGQGLRLSQVAIVAAALCDALAYMHSRGIVHCDLNPSNILFSSEGQPRLVDLGIAHVPDAFVHRAWRTEREIGMGTVFYMAPEQLDGVRDDPRVDLYALGAICYQMLAGSPYLDFDLSRTPAAQADNVNRVRGQMPRPIPAVPREVNAVVLRALAKAPEDRYPDVLSFRRSLVQAMSAHLPSDMGLGLMAPFAPRQEAPAVRLDAIDWPAWVWAVLFAMNAVLMLAMALLLLGSS